LLAVRYHSWHGIIGVAGVSTGPEKAVAAPRFGFSVGKLYSIGRLDFLNPSKLLIVLKLLGVA
jgi:hypothetical protein